MEDAGPHTPYHHFNSLLFTYSPRIRESVGCIIRTLEAGCMNVEVGDNFPVGL